MDNVIYMTSYLNETLRLLRESEVIDIYDLAEAFNTDPEYIWAIENKNKRPTETILRKYSEYFNLSDDFFEQYKKDIHYKGIRGKFLRFIFSLMKKCEKYLEVE